MGNGQWGSGWRDGDGLVDCMRTLVAFIDSSKKCASPKVLDMVLEEAAAAVV